MNTQSSPPDFVGYENLITYLETNSLHKLQGDLIEIGAFMGGGTVKLAQYAQKYDRKLYVVDIFEPIRDQTLSKSGETACSVYEAFLDAAAEGWRCGGEDSVVCEPIPWFRRHWDVIDGQKHPWASTPWVRVVEFKPIDKRVSI